MANGIVSSGTRVHTLTNNNIYDKYNSNGSGGGGQCVSI